YVSFLDFKSSGQPGRSGCTPSPALWTETRVVDQAAPAPFFSCPSAKAGQYLSARLCRSTHTQGRPGMEQEKNAARAASEQAREAIVGVDVAKAKLDVALKQPKGKWKTKVVDKTPGGFEQ